MILTVTAIFGRVCRRTELRVGFNLLLKISDYVTLTAQRKCHPLGFLFQQYSIAQYRRVHEHPRYYSLRDYALNEP